MFFVLAMGNALMAIAIALVNFRENHSRAMTLWAFGNAAASAAWTLYALRGFIPYPPSVLGGFACIAGAQMLQTAALIEFTGRKVAWVVMFSLFVLSASGLVSDFLLYGGDSRTMVVSASLGVALWMLAPVAVLFALAPSGDAFVYRMTGLFFAASGVIDAYRGIDAIFGANPTSALLDVSVTQSLTFGGAFVAMLGTSLGFMMMTKKRTA